MSGRIRDAYDFLYFRLIYSPALVTPLSLSGMWYLAGHWSLEGLGVLICTWTASFSLVNGMLFRSGIDQKARVWTFLDKYRGARFERLPTTDILRLFNIDFLIPSSLRPRRLFDYLRRERWCIYFVERGEAAHIFSSPRVFVTPLALDIYIFLRDRSLHSAGADSHFRVAHELGHCATFRMAALRRNLLGLNCALASVFWILLIAPHSPTLLGCTIAILLLGLRLRSREYPRFRQTEAFHSEIIADYMALRHLSRESAAELLTRKAPPFGRDPDLSEDQNRLRARTYWATLRAVAEGQPIEIPQLYMDYVRRPPPLLVMFTFLQWAYVAYFSWGAHVTAYLALPVGLLPLTFYLFQVYGDARAGTALESRLSEPSAAEPG